MRPRRVVAVSVLVAVVGGGAGVLGLNKWTLTPAHARTQPTATVTEGREFTATYPPIAASFPNPGAETTPTPASCATGGELEVACDVVPFVIEVPPSLGPEDDFSLEVEVAWDDPANQDDIDIYFWDDRQIARRANPDATTYTRMADAATQDNPERIRLFRPDLGKYNLTVLNFLGPNTGYRVTARLVLLPFENPFEAVAPTPTRPPSPPPAEPPPAEAPPPIDTPQPVEPDAPPGPGLEEVPVGGDDDFAGLTTPGTALETATAPPAVRPLRPAAAGPPRPVPWWVLLFWFVLAPVGLVVWGATVLRRRSRTALPMPR